MAKRKTEKQTPTMKVYGALQEAYDRFNAELFGDELPHCVLTLQRYSTGRGKVYGFFAEERFAVNEGEGEKVTRDEIALNPAWFHERELVDILSTLVHEMVHLWQHHFGTPTPSNPHNQEWADKMKSIGLQPVNAKGGETGRSVSHTIMGEGAFIDAAPSIAGKVEVGLRELPPPPAKAKKPKSGAYSKYVCGKCKAVARAKPKMDLRCGDHGRMAEIKAKAKKGMGA